MAATLTDVISELKLSRDVEADTRESIDALVNVVSKHISMLGDQFERDRLNAEENRREQSRLRDRFSDPKGLPGPNEAHLNGPFDLIKSVFGGTFLGNFLSNFVKVLVLPLKNLGKFLRVGGPLALAATALYLIFKDIGDNPRFVAVMEKVQTVWNEKILPLFDRIQGVFSAIAGSEELDGALGIIQAAWQNFTWWLGEKFVPAFQNTFIGIIDGVANLFSGLADSINLLLDGEWRKGLTGIFESIGVFVWNSLDTVLTEIFSALGVDFGEDGTLFTSIKGQIDNLIQWIINGFDSIGNFFVITIPQWFEDAKTFVNEQFWAMVTKTKELVVGAIDALGITDAITATIDAIKITYQTILDGFKGFIDWIANIPTRVKEYVQSILPDWMKDDPVLKGSDATDLLRKLDREAEESRRKMEEHFGVPPTPQGLTLPPTISPNSSSSSNLLQDGRSSGERTLSSMNLVVSNDNRTSNVTSSSTNMVGFGAPINEYAPW